MNYPSLISGFFCVFKDVVRKETIEKELKSLRVLIFRDFIKITQRHLLFL